MDDVVRVARGGEPVRILDTALTRMALTRRKVEEALQGNVAVYALNTGVGLLANVRLDLADIDQMQLNLVRSHCCGVGEPLPVDVARAMMLIRANILAMGLSGIWPEVGERLCDFLNHGITPGGADAWKRRCERRPGAAGPYGAGTDRRRRSVLAWRASRRLSACSAWG